MVQTMNCEDIFKLELRLEKISLITVAGKLWDRPDIREEIRKYFVDNDCPNCWDNITNHVMQHVNLLPIPGALLSNIKNYVPVIGKKICTWTEYVTKKLGFPLNYAETIYWTSDGMINELKIVDEYWLKETDFVANDYHTFLTKPLFSVATLYGRENFIKENVSDMRRELNVLLPKELKNDNWTIYGMLSAWLIFHLSPTRNDALKVLRNFKQRPNDLPPKPLFMKCVRYNYKFAAKYFWDKLTINEKQASIMETAEESLDDIGYVRANQIEILIFQLREMSVMETTDFLSQYFASFFEYCLTIWPYQEVCINLLDQNWVYDPNDIKELLKFCIKCLLCYPKRKEVRDKQIYRIVFQKLLERTSKETKLKYFVKGNCKKFCFRYNYFDLVALSLILRDPDLKEHKNKILTDCDDIFKNAILNERYKDLNLFLNNAFYYDEEKKLFKQKFNFLTFFLSSGKFESAENHLIWLYDSENDRLAAKEQIDSLEIAKNFVKMYRLDLADKFLLWIFKTEEERKHFKKVLRKSNKFLRDEIYKIWCSKKLGFEEKCSQLLDWFFGATLAGRQIIQFRRTKLIENEKFILRYWRLMPQGRSLTNIESFLTFCLQSLEDVKEIKTRLANNICWWIDSFMLSDRKFIDALLDWIGKDNDLKKAIVKYMVSPAGALLCVNFCTKYFNSQSAMLDFLNSWWFDKSLTGINISEMKTNLAPFDSTVATEDLKKFILTMLAKRKKGKTIKLRDLPKNMDKLNCNGSDKSTDCYEASDYTDDEDDNSSDSSRGGENEYIEDTSENDEESEIITVEEGEILTLPFLKRELRHKIIVK